MKAAKDHQSPVPNVRMHLSADALFGGVRQEFEKVKDPFPGEPGIPLSDVLMSAFAMFSLKDPSLLAFDVRRKVEGHNLQSIYGIGRIPCDTQMRSRLDPLEADSLRSAFKEVFRRAQRGKLLEDMVYMEGCVLVSGDGTTYFASEKLSSPACLKKTCSKTGKITYSIQTYGAAGVHPDRKEVIPLAPEPIFNHDGDTKNDCERNAARRWQEKFRKDHPHLRVIMVEDALSSNAPHIRDLKKNRFHFILGLKEGDHIYLSSCMDAAVDKGEAIVHDLPDPKDPGVHHFFRFANHLPLNESNQDLLVNLLEYRQLKGDERKYFCWITDFTLTRENASSNHAGRPCKVENRERDLQHTQEPGVPLKISSIQALITRLLDPSDPFTPSTTLRKRFNGNCCNSPQVFVKGGLPSALVGKHGGCGSFSFADEPFAAVGPGRTAIPGFRRARVVPVLPSGVEEVSAS